MRRQNKMQVTKVGVSRLPFGARGRPHKCISALVMFLLAMSGSPAPAEAASSVAPYRFAPGDRVTITVFGQTDLSGDFLVDGDGHVSMPMVGSISIDGLTAQDTEREIAKRLSDGYLRQPSVSVRIGELRPIYVVGDVKLPGSYPYRYGASVLSAVAMAGGIGVVQQLQLRETVIAEFLAADERVRVLESTRRALLVRQARLAAERDGARTFEAPEAIEHKSDAQITTVVASEREILDIQI